jgi:hypothetical protein
LFVVLYIFFLLLLLLQLYLPFSQDPPLFILDIYLFLQSFLCLFFLLFSPSFFFVLCSDLGRMTIKHLFCSFFYFLIIMMWNYLFLVFSFFLDFILLFLSHDLLPFQLKPYFLLILLYTFQLVNSSAWKIFYSSMEPRLSVIDIFIVSILILSHFFDFLF